MPDPLSPTDQGASKRRAQRLSFCITTRGPAARVRALLKLVRPHAAEIVLAVDRGGDVSTLDACADLAEQRLAFEPVDSPASLIGWVAHRCGGDWILRLDDDEIPSPGLLDALPELMRERYPTHFLLPCRWLFPNPDTFIESFPWNQGFQPRLFRNLPGLWSFRGEVHDAGTFLGESRALDLPMYHADLLLSSLAERVAKVARYEWLRPQYVMDGVSVNATYLPEQWSSPLRQRAVPDEDREVIAQVLDPPAAPARSGGAPVHVADRLEVDFFTGRSRPTPGRQRGSIRFEGRPEALPAGAIRHLLVVARNDGDRPWPAGQTREPRVRLGCRWRHAASEEIASEEQPRSYFTETVMPGQSTRMLLGLNTPRTPGEYLLEVDLVHEEVRWFGCCARTPVTIEPARTGAWGPHSRTRAARGGRPSSGAQATAVADRAAGWLRSARDRLPGPGDPSARSRSETER